MNLKSFSLGPGPRVAWLVGLALTLLAWPGAASGLRFAMIGKRLDDVNFQEAWRGCQNEARLFGDQCELLGSQGSSESRRQLVVFQDALRSHRFAAMAISVTGSELIAGPARSAEVPIIAFDSPFATTDQDCSRTYVGTDNRQLGRDLGRIARRLRPRGGTLCLMTAANDPNLAMRVQGLRIELSGDEAWPAGRLLSGEHGWTELPRSPWNSGDDLDRVQDELQLTFQRLRPDLFISVGHWPVYDTGRYRQIVAPFREDLRTKKRLVLVAVGKVLPGYRALLDDKLIHGLVAIDFNRIGRACYRSMKAAVEGRPLPATTTIANTLLVGK